MQVTDDIAKVRKIRNRSSKLTWGFVPTMGALHAGHLSLVKAAKKENDKVAVSIFVNPTQFGPNEDFAKYPRTLEADIALLKELEVDLVWMPTKETIYPTGYETYVQVEELGSTLEGASRPGFFKGVATVVTKLFNVIEPTRAYFGQKDAQQARLIEKMVCDLNFDLEIQIMPIVREENGLALSSRNKYLTREQKEQASALYAGLKIAEQRFLEGERSVEILHALIVAHLDKDYFKIDYIKIVDSETFEEIEIIKKKAYIVLAVYLGAVRLIDNFLLNPSTFME